MAAVHHSKSLAIGQIFLQVSTHHLLAFCISSRHLFTHARTACLFCIIISLLVPTSQLQLLDSSDIYIMTTMQGNHAFGMPHSAASEAAQVRCSWAQGWFPGRRLKCTSRWSTCPDLLDERSAVPPPAPAPKTGRLELCIPARPSCLLFGLFNWRRSANDTATPRIALPCRWAVPGPV